MITLWERRSADNDRSLSLEHALPEDADDPHFTFVLVMIDRVKRGGPRLLHLGVLHYGRRVVGVGALLGGRLRELRWDRWTELR